MNTQAKRAHHFRKNKELFFLSLPAILVIFVFSYLPMAGLVIAFKDIDYSTGVMGILFGGKWVGFDNFKFFFESQDAFRVTRNTILLNAAFIAIGKLERAARKGGSSSEKGLSNRMYIPGFGIINGDSGFVACKTCSDGYFRVGKDAVTQIFRTGDGKVELIVYEDRSIAYVKSSMGYPAYYPVRDVDNSKRIKAVLMDLDGTTVRSEDFWINIIEMCVQSLIKSSDFNFVQADIPFVSGHSVSEHLNYCIKKYCPHESLDTARKFYFEHTRREMQAILKGRGRANAFTPAPGVRDFLLEVKAKGLKLGLVTSGLKEKAYPAILSAFQSMKLGRPEDFYDCIITAGESLQSGDTGTLGELEAKPHPWLYAESVYVGLGIPADDADSVVGIEDSGAGVCSVRLAGCYTAGISGGNIIDSGTLGFCNGYFEDFEQISKLIAERI